MHLLAGGQRESEVEALEDEAAILQPEPVDLLTRHLPDIVAESATTLPSSGFSRPETAAEASTAEPDGPSPAISPGSMSRSMPFSTSTLIWPARKLFFRPRAAMA